MTVPWTDSWPLFVTAFLASLVEFVEALTVILAVGSTRGWQGALIGTCDALAVLCVLVLVCGPAISMLPLADIQFFVGALLLLFGMRWLRKAVLRSAGVIPVHDQIETFNRERNTLGRAGGVIGTTDRIAVATTFNITMLEGIEVVFIVIALGSGGKLVAASAGAVAALLVVVCLGLVLHRPLSNIPENAIKFVVGTLLSAFGTFWVGEGLGLSWPAEDWSILALSLGWFAVALAAVGLCRRSKTTAERPS
jgi:Ca2+/H+ antiporter, TMEM165/GDT1 family